MARFAIVVHGGAGPDEPFIHENEAGYLAGLRAAADAGYTILDAGGTSLDAVEAAVRSLEDNELFNAGRGSALTEEGAVEMCASLMDGATRGSGAVAVVRNVRNPISLARTVLEKTDIIYVAGPAAVVLAQEHDQLLEDDGYFITEHQREELAKELEKQAHEEKGKQSGTIGAVAVDRHGHVAAATSTGGIPGAKKGRVADSSMIGIGSYANDQTLAVSSTGDGEYSIRAVTAYDVACAKEFGGMSPRQACTHVIHERNGGIDGDLGVIAIDATGDFGWAFNSERMHRGWRAEGDATAQARIYGDA